MLDRVLTLTSVELYKLARQKFAYILIGFVIMNGVLVAVGSRVFPAIMSALGGGGGGSTFDGYTFASIIASGTFSAVGAGTISMLAYSGSMVSAETESGTLKNILVRPLYRREFILAKALALLAFCAVIVAVMAALSLAASVAFYGLGDISIVETGEVYRTRPEMLVNLFIMYAMDLSSIYTVACLGLLLSVLINNGGWAVITSLVLYFPVMFLKNFDIFSPWIFTAYMDLGQNVLREMALVKSKTWSPEIFRFIAVNAATTAALLAASVAAFGRKEIS